jgi:hypothetical protein
LTLLTPTDCICSTCPGRHIALWTIWGTIAAVLSIYDIGPSLNEDGTLHVPSGEFTTGFLRRVSTSFNLFYFISISHLLFLCTPSIGIQLQLTCLLGDIMNSDLTILLGSRNHSSVRLNLDLCRRRRSSGLWGRRFLLIVILDYAEKGKL